MMLYRIRFWFSFVEGLTNVNLFMYFSNCVSEYFSNLLKLYIRVQSVDVRGMGFTVASSPVLLAASGLFPKL